MLVTVGVGDNNRILLTLLANKTLFLRWSEASTFRRCRSHRKSFTNITMLPTSRRHQHHDVTNITDTILLRPIFNSFYRLNKNVHIFVFDQAVSWGFSFLMVSVHRISKPTSQSFLHQKIVSLLLRQTDRTIELWKLFSNSFFYDLIVLSSFYICILSRDYPYNIQCVWVFDDAKMSLSKSKTMIIQFFWIYFI